MRTLFLSRSLSLALLMLATHIVNAQTYFYINSISVSPAEPTESDAITISLTGDLSSSGAYVVSAEYMLMSNIVHITVTAADNGGLSVLVPHTEEVPIGTLPEGSYAILVDGTGVLDSAPEFQHGFNVSGGGPNCTDLDLISVQWATFSDTAINVNVSNASIGFDYPGFILFDANGDTLAKETVELFAIGEESWHSLRIHPDADVPSGAFTGRLELWTGFYNDLACTWEQSFDLCPASECVTVYPYLGNFGDALVTGSFSWSVNNNAGPVMNGTFTLAGENQSDMADVCLSPGSYAFVVTPLQEPGGGQLYMGVGGAAWSDDVQQILSPATPSAPLVFDVLPGCSDGTNGVDELNDRAGSLDIRTYAGGLDLRTMNGISLGAVTLVDAVGRTIYEIRTTSDRIRIPLNTSGVFIVSTDAARVKVIVGE